MYVRETLHLDRSVVNPSAEIKPPEEENSLNFDATLCNLNVPMTYTDIEHPSQDESEIKRDEEITIGLIGDKLPENYHQLPEGIVADPNGEGSFGYSQKFFHISDGNLYSVFSPLQGRSYGVKPSFLRKHRCMVQETKGKKGGRRNTRRGLKFHNFIPSESVTSEREEKPTRFNSESIQQNQNGFGENRTQGNDEVWKVHARCRLQEEHGTKQITVASWSHSSNSPASASSWRSKPSSLSANELELPQIMQEKQQTDYQQHNMSIPPLYPSQTDSKLNCVSSIDSSTISRPSVLQQYLESGQNLPLTTLVKDDDASLESMESGSTNSFGGDTSDFNKRHRRKQVTTKRVVPYTKYLTMLDESPLDLSSHKDGVQFATEPNQKIAFFENVNMQSKIEEFQTANGYSNQTETPGGMVDIRGSYGIYPQCPPYSQIPFSSEPSNVSASSKIFRKPSSTMVNPSYQPVATNSGRTGCSTLQSLLTSGGEVQYAGETTKSSEILPPGFMSLQQTSTNPNKTQFNYEKSQASGGPSGTIRPRRKPSQRTLIRQKLEDTFKQNGFLVKTKQVSDGDATFCKFKQLRKYTRYYLKSWHQHLPEEVHKLWKGFLPPKTPLNLPRASNTENANEESGLQEKL